MAHCACVLCSKSLGSLDPQGISIGSHLCLPLEMSALPGHTLTSARQKQSISTCSSGLAWLYCLKNHHSVDTWEPGEGVQVHEANIARGQATERPRSQWMRPLCGSKCRFGLIGRGVEKCSLTIFFVALRNKHSIYLLLVLQCSQRHAVA
jgi:hypothetical protein